MSGKFFDILANFVLTLIGIAFLAVPALYATYETFWLMVATYFMYGALTINSIAYMIGTINCDKSIATVIVAELEATKAWYSNVIPIIVAGICIYAIFYQSMYLMSMIVIAPLLLNKLGRIILKNKAKLNASPSTS